MYCLKLERMFDFNIHEPETANDTDAKRAHKYYHILLVLTHW